jgi:hypothetical protein
VATINITEDPITDDDTQTDFRERNTARDETQVALDTAVGGLVKSWAEAGKPGRDKAPAKRYVVVKADVSGLKSMIRRACTLHKVAPVWFVDNKRDDGTVAVKFTVGPIPPKAPKPDPAADTAPPADPAPKPGPGKPKG